MKVLVTGGAGFIGSHVADLLLAREYDVVIVDNLSTGKLENVSKEATFYKVDITSEEIKELVRKEGIEYVVHHAAQAQVRRSLEDPVFDAKVNILGSLNLLECCRDAKKFIYASSGGAVYGEPQYLPVDEEHPVNPLSPYGASKYAVEKYLQIYSDVYGLGYVSLRYGNVYGPRQDPFGEAGVIAIFGGKMLRSEQPTIFGDGEQTRDFVYVEDIARANLLSMEEGNGIYNIGTGKETSVNQIFETMRQILGVKMEADFGSPIPGEVRRISLDASRAKAELGWKAQVSIEKGLEKTLRYLKGEITDNP
ncbi:MAG: SDR family oxidoreductase [Candidatus Hydrothermarchaeales archaeon]